MGILYLAPAQIALLSFRLKEKSLIEIVPLLDIKRHDKKAMFIAMFSIFFRYRLKPL
jgi:hypothetical protein